MVLYPGSNPQLVCVLLSDLQALVRRNLSNKHLHSMLERQASAIKIQAQFRQFREYHIYQLLLLEVVPAASVAQRHWRGFVQRRAYASIIDCTIILQALWRGALEVRRDRARRAGATCIQRIWRGFWTQLHYQMDMLDIVAVQCLVRKQQANQLARRRTHAVATLQSAARLFVAKLVLERKRRERNAAITIQVWLLG